MLALLISWPMATGAPASCSSPRSGRLVIIMLLRRFAPAEAEASLGSVKPKSLILKM